MNAVECDRYLRNEKKKADRRAAIALTWAGMDAADYYEFMGVKPERAKELIAAAKQQAAKKTIS